MISFQLDLISFQLLLYATVEARLMFGVLDSRSSDPGSSPGRGHCVVFLGKTLYSHSAPLNRGVQKGTDEFNVGVALRWTSIPTRGE